MSPDPKGRPEAPHLRSRTTTALVATVVLLAAGLAGLGWGAFGPPKDVWALAVFALMGVVSWVVREPDVGSRVQLSFLSIILLTSAVVVGPAGAAIVGALATVIQFERHPLVVRVFNAALFSLMGSAGGVAYIWSGGTTAVSGIDGAGSMLLRVGLPMIVADVVQCILNAVLIALIMRASGGTPIRTQFTKLLGTTGMAYIGYGVIGFLFVVLWIPARVGWFSAVLVLAPLFVARWAFAQYGDELRAHERTLRALVTAVEIKEPQNQGHSERVAQLSEWLAESLGLGHKDIQDIRTAGMLHDIGKISVPTPLLRGRRSLTDDELVVLADHAHAGVELVRSIDFVAGSLDGIAHHHERVDGRGYPSGLSREQIPLPARIVAVADAFDALTSHRPYRDAHRVQDALAQLQDRAGTHLDPVVVDALGRVVSRHGWQTRQAPVALDPSAGAATDHDDPEMSDYLAERPDLLARVAERATRLAAAGQAGQDAGAPTSSVPHTSTATPGSTASPASREEHHQVGGRL